MAGGISAIVLQRRNGKHEHYNPWRYTAPLQQQAPAEVEIKWPPELAATLTHITERLEGSLQKLEVQSRQPAWPEVVSELERVTKRVMVAARPPDEPQWAKRLEDDLQKNDDRMVRLAEDLAENMTDNMARFYAGVSRDLKQPDVKPTLVALTGELSKLSELPGKISRGVTEALIHERKKNNPPNKGNNDPPPPYVPPRNLPPMTPGEMPATPSIPAPYVAGTVHVPAGEVWSLLYLIQKQLSLNCPGTSAEFALTPGEGTIFVGAASSIGGKLTEDNYAYKLEEGDDPRIYRSSFPGNNTPVGEIQVLGSGSVHVEVQS